MQTHSSPALQHHYRRMRLGTREWRTRWHAHWRVVATSRAALAAWESVSEGTRWTDTAASQPAFLALRVKRFGLWAFIWTIHVFDHDTTWLVQWPWPSSVQSQVNILLGSMSCRSSLFKTSDWNSTKQTVTSIHSCPKFVLKIAMYYAHTRNWW